MRYPGPASNRTTLTLLLTLALLSACQPQAPAPRDTGRDDLMRSADSLLTAWHAAAARADFEAYFAPTDSVFYYLGTDATENWPREEFMAFCKPYFDKGRAWEFTAIERNIYLNDQGETAWFDELLDTWMGTCRGSGVLERRAGEWKLQHYVLSILIPNEHTRDVVALKQASDSVFRAGKEDDL